MGGPQGRTCASRKIGVLGFDDIDLAADVIPAVTIDVKKRIWLARRGWPAQIINGAESGLIILVLPSPGRRRAAAQFLDPPALTGQ
jgi:hypothetical protein